MYEQFSRPLLITYKHLKSIDRLKSGDSVVVHKVVNLMISLRIISTPCT